MAEREEMAFLLAAFSHCLLLASLSLQSQQNERMRARALQAYETTLRFMDKVVLSAGDEARLAPLLRKIESRLLSAHNLAEPT